MTRTVPLFAFCLMVTAGNLAAQSSIPEAGLAAEGHGRWGEALQIYREQLGRTRSDADLWIRVADIEARLGRPAESIAALERAAQAAPQNAAVIARLSQAYAAQGHPAPALRAIEGALALQPDSPEHLRAHATLATWAGDYGGAARSYRRLRALQPNDRSLALALARVSVWAGESDDAAAAYREYLRAPDAASEAWLELARAESWRGNVAAAMDALQRYRAQSGTTEAYARERAAVLARGGRPREALRELSVLMTRAPGDADLRLSHAIALASIRHHGEAVSSLAGAEALRPGHADARAAQSLVRTLLGSNVGPSVTFYDDSDGLQTTRIAPRADIGFETDTRLHAGYEHIDLRARAGSGLDQVTGSTSAAIDHVWAGLSQRFGPLTVGGTLGQARTAGDDLTTYAAFARFAPTDTFAASFERSSAFAAVSPRTAGLGLTRVSHRAQLDWSPALRYYVALDGSYEDLSDGNARWEVFASPRAVITRSQRLNMDLGVMIHQFGARENLDNGYYDPRRYEYYSVLVAPYWKTSENIGLAVTAGLGAQRDELSRRFRLGSNASAEATFGIYRQWLLKVNGSVTNNRRLDSGAFRGVSGGIVLQRRF